MSEIDFRKKMSFRRHYGTHRDAHTEYDIIKRFESDRGRIINSAAIRRLQQKTQVFPLERNAAVRSRLTHSMEVQQVGRYIAKEIFYALHNSGKLADYGLTQLQSSVESVVEMACLMHDIGNPPFGHFGEAAINNWFDKRLDTASCGSEPQSQDLCTPIFLRLKEGETDLNRLRSKVRRDLAHFEGNAQAIRLVHTLLRLNLTYAQIACVLKYTLPAYATEKVPSHSYLTKKPGFYLAEEDFVATLRQALGMDEFARFPLTYIMEAADDISYCIADLDDAVEKDIFSVYQLYDYLKAAWGEGEPGDLFDKVVGSAFNKMIRCPEKRRNDNVFFMTLRVNTVGELVPHAAMRFVDNLDAIYHGHFNEALLEGDSPAKRLLGIFKQVALKRVFNHPEVEQLELQGYRVISGLLDIYSPLLAMPMVDFRQMVQEESHRGYPIETRLFHKLSSKHRLAYVEATDALRNLPDDRQQIWEYYYRARFIQDYISGMTDNYAYDEYRRLMAAE
ncbi:dGTPase [Serratia entomophila]|uniref:dGTPase n=1 Tax=Serratia entomophila TaxID=42906 RepID=UPI00217705B6|nr:dGTPase [Serratia entomophila]CAI0968019.1 Deoxyguanosinetriphosphate triphosphohydrolase [Serratia entomophila]CAI0970125.1 Deoxyguanosinetriphosphate triphosphohydrolase [Serratia entomophila]CAI1804184.1 Deoxyguanosinetriphosphate triphosphohydrolase [Serratia entomophila]CAI1826664.1 Deoxyguanosinetriphosphate triphosphohydrolase [Serratia entomophila]CAI1830655.1 Deoxyguanosinetriphosphate triphosphohydrolase [Serratia entomophila]